jgi:CBS domain-containing protein
MGDPAGSARNLADVIAFLERFPPFRDLERHQLEELARHVEVASFEMGSLILQQGGEPSDHLLVVRSGVVELMDEGRVTDHLGEGELIGISVLSRLSPALTVRARETTECYRIDIERSRELLGTPVGLAFLARSVAMWKRQGSVDLHRQRAGGGDALAEAIAGGSDVAAVSLVAARLPDSVRTFLDEGVDPIDVGHVVGATIDHLTRRFIELAVAKLGEPPTPFAWIALGSAARHEQALNTDQDHAIAYGCDDGEVDEIDPYFAELARSVTDGLEACGIARCRGGVMAENPAWRRTVAGWRRRFGEYISDPDVRGTRVACIAFDYRRVVGPVNLEENLDDMIRDARSDPGFMRRLAQTALENDAPVSRRHDIVTERGGEHPGTVDIKHGGITLVTNLARYYAVEAGISEDRTVERLRGAVASGVLSDEMFRDLRDALRVLWRIRLEHHADRLELGAPPDDNVDPTALRPIIRQALGASLRVVSDAQEYLAKRSF